MKTGIIIGTRGSKLALVQTGMVAEKIKELHPGLSVSISKVLTAGDRDQLTRLDQLGEAIFVKELEQALLNGTIDIAVHSLKDLPTEIPTGLRLLAITGREDPRDAVVARMKLKDLPVGSSIGTDSLRRTTQLLHFYPHLKINSLRGNVDTRIQKVTGGGVDGIILAVAGLKRLGFQDKITEYLPLEKFLPSVGQGALAIEGRTNDAEIAEIITPLNDVPSWQSVTAERVFLFTLGGGCRAPIGAIGTVEKKILKLEGMVASVSTGKIIRGSEEGDASHPEEVGQRLAKKLMAMGASVFIDEVRK